MHHLRGGASVETITTILPNDDRSDTYGEMLPRTVVQRDAPWRIAGATLAGVKCGTGARLNTRDRRR